MSWSDDTELSLRANTIGWNSLKKRRSWFVSFKKKRLAYYRYECHTHILCSQPSHCHVEKSSHVRANRDILKWIHCRLAFTIMLLDVFHVHQCCSCLGFGKCLKSKMSKIDHRISKIDLDIPVSVSCELHKPVLLNL